MPKNIFRIIAFKCLIPEHPLVGELHYVNRMQRSLYGNDRWYVFYQKAHVSTNGERVRLDSGFADDSVLYDTESLSVSVSAIVGENGSGKSSILDMMLRVLNNATTALFGEAPQYAAAEHLHYIEHVYGCIVFMQGANLKMLSVRGRYVEISSYRKMQGVALPVEEQMFRLQQHKDVWLDAANADINNLMPRQKNKMAKIAELFYTVVCNYSLYAYNPNDYWEEFTTEQRIDKVHPKQNYDRYPYLRCWLTGLFHKNDGYQVPLVINPMRLNGVINAPKENRLAKERLLSMLFYSCGRHANPIERYPFRIINRDHVIVGLAINERHDGEYAWTKDWMVSKGLFGKRSRLYTHYEAISESILDYLEGFYAIDRQGVHQLQACRYLVYKILKIAQNYKKYNKILSNLRKQNCSIDLLHRHLDELLYDQSHVTVKLRRTLMYLVHGMYNDNRQVYDLEQIQQEAETHVQEMNDAGDEPQRGLADFLPPPIFDVEFRIVRREHIRDDGHYGDRHIIPFWSLSSGERQVAYVISNFVYHLVNINSVNTIDAKEVAGVPLLKYKYINIIFDEIELYFHPDLQRRFLYLLVEALRNIHLEYVEGVNILLVTHSPFVLSDLPKSNVLALSDKTEEMGETFCANIHEMLGHSFFMEYSMGKIAQEQVEEIFSTYNRKMEGEDVGIDEDTWRRYEYIASIVGDEYLHSTLGRVMKALSDKKERRDER